MKAARDVRTEGSEKSKPRSRKPAGELRNGVGEGGSGLLRMTEAEKPRWRGGKGFRDPLLLASRPAVESTLGPSQRLREEAPEAGAIRLQRRCWPSDPRKEPCHRAVRERCTRGRAMTRSPDRLLHVRVGLIWIKAERRSATTVATAGTFFLHRCENTARSGGQRGARLLRSVERVRRTRYASTAEGCLLLLAALSNVRRQVEFEAGRGQRHAVHRGGRRVPMPCIVAVWRGGMGGIGRARRRALRAGRRVRRSIVLCCVELRRVGRAWHGRTLGGPLHELASLGHGAEMMRAVARCVGCQACL